MVDIKEEIKSRIDIVDLISRYIPVKKAGSNYKANCPFHNEDTPSFMVSPSLQIFKCFGCQKGGDIFTFLMEIEGIDFKQALSQLGEEAGVDVSKYINSASNKEEKDLLKINESASQFYSYCLLSTDAGAPALKYLKERGLTLEHINFFKLGYSPNSWDKTFSFLQNKGFSLEQIYAAGFCKKGSKGGFYDVYRGRIMFPLINEVGKIVGFSGRTIIGEEPKYINTKDTSVFKKSNFVYNLNNAKLEIKKQKYSVVVEGEFDAISPFIRGVKNVVALKGTAFTQAQAKLLKRYAEEAVIFFDSDLAGQAAGIRGIEIAQNTDLNVKVATLPKEYKDPDEACKVSIDIVYKAIDEAVFSYDYLFKYALSIYDVKNPIDKVKISNFLKARIINIKNDILRSHYTKKLEELLDMSRGTIELKTTENEETPKIEESRAELMPVSPTLISYLLRAKPKIYKKFIKTVIKNKMCSKDQEKILEKYQKDVIGGKKSKDAFIAENNSVQDDFLFNLEYFESSEELQEKVLSELINRFLKDKYKKRMRDLEKEIKLAESKGDLLSLDKLKKSFRIFAKRLSNTK